MANLLEETLEVLETYNLTIKDIKWIGSEDFKIQNFFDIANIIYDEGFGGQRIPYDLVIVGEDWWLERAEYDGSEWWRFMKKPIEPSKEKKLENLPLGAYDSLVGLVEGYEWEKK